MMDRKDEELDGNVFAAMLREYYDNGSKLTATTIKSYLENDNNSREEAIKLCDMIIEDANSEILSIHASLDEQIN